jgi:foldase protein PrsA
VKRQAPAVLLAVLVVAGGALASACDVTPPAATANGATISTATFNSQLQTLQTTVAGSCLLQLENAQLAAESGQGQGGPGTFTMNYANAVLNNQVGDLLAVQFAASLGITVSSADLVTAKSDFASTLDGEISQAVTAAQSEGTVSFCEGATGSAITGAQLLAALPTPIRDEQIRNQAVDEKLLARGADLSDAAVAAYYQANKAQFTQVCVSAIGTDSEAKANLLLAEINSGTPFATVAKNSSLDAKSAANGGAQGCNYTLARIEQGLQKESITVGAPIAPVEISSTGQWAIYEVTSATVEPLSAVSSLVKRELLQATTNVTRVSKEIVAFARTSDVSVDPEYGTWKGLTVVPPVAPPSRYLLAAVSGTPITSTGSSLGLGSVGSTSTGSGSTGASGSGTGG